MSGFFYILLSPVLVLLSVQLSIFAAFTTTIAFSMLVFRALLVYAELAAALLQDHLAVYTPSKGVVLPCNIVGDDKHLQQRTRRESTASVSSIGGPTTPKLSDVCGFGVYGGHGVNRDFEGVGGWRIPRSEGEDKIWTTMNSRLELPATSDDRHRNHYRSRTSGSLTSYGLPMRAPRQSRAQTPVETMFAARSTSPEEYFAHKKLSKSTTALDIDITEKMLLRHKQSGSSSASSQESTHTAHLTLLNA